MATTRGPGYNAAVTSIVDTLERALAPMRASATSTPFARARAAGHARREAERLHARALHGIVETTGAIVTDRGLGITALAPFAEAKGRAYASADLAVSSDAPTALLFALTYAHDLRLATRRSRAEVLALSYLALDPTHDGLLAALDPAREPLAGPFRVAFERLAAGLAPETIVEPALEGATLLESVAWSIDAPTGGDALDRVRGLNVYAGRHVVPEDVREVRAALCAAEDILGASPYIERRYGVRGRRFTVSDTALLATLAHYDAATVHREARWLVELLSLRGLSSLLVEEQLHHLVLVLERTLPENAARYATLAEAAHTLSRERRGALDDDAVARLVALFEACAPTDERKALPEAARLVVGAVVDEARGWAGAVEATIPWLKDARTFSAAWIAALDRLVMATWLEVAERRRRRPVVTLGAPANDRGEGQP